jgi:hypothetical protein
MISATLLEVFFIPVFYVLIERIADRVRRAPAPVPAATPESESA